eukprot:1407754-Prymnesium_polylepis.1
MTPQFQGARLAPESREGWAKVSRLLGVVDSVLGPARALVDAAASLLSGVRRDVPLATSNVLDLLLKILVIGPTEKVVGVPLLCTARMDSSLLAILAAALERQRSRTLSMGVETAMAARAAQQAAAARAAKAAEDMRLAAAKAAADQAVRALRRAQQPGWFAPPSVDAIEAAITVCRQKGVDEALLTRARAHRDVLLANE